MSLLLAQTSHHKTEQASEYSSHRPCRIPCVRMEIAYGQAEALVGFKSTAWSNHCDLGGFEGKVGGKHKLAVVETIY